MSDMAVFESIFPLFGRSEDVLRSEFDVRANAGLSPDDEGWIDTRQGSAYHLATQPLVIELAAAYDRMNEVVAASILATSWGKYLDAHAASFGQERLAASYAEAVITFTGVPGTLIGTGLRVGIVQTDPDVETPIYETVESGTIPIGGSVQLTVRALESGEAGNAAQDEITLLVTGLEGIESLTNPAPASGGAEVETDDALKERLMVAFSGGGNATKAAYAQEALRWPGIGRVAVEVAWNGPGTVRLVVQDDAGDPVPGSVVADLQDHMDPVTGGGEGWAPINHDVEVATAIIVPVNVAAQVEFKPGYSLDGAGGTVALRSQIENAINTYLDGLLPGEDVIYNHVIAQFFLVDGVLDVNNTVRTGTGAPPAVGVVDIAMNGVQVAAPGVIDLT
jgi:uncharacterized phage protein gp47/JayE